MSGRHPKPDRVEHRGLRDARIRLMLAGGVALVAGEDGPGRWLVHGRPANPAERFVLEGVTLADVEEVHVLSHLLPVLTPEQRMAMEQETTDLLLGAARTLCTRGLALLAAHPDEDGEPA